jgi:hypothetical protein
MLVKARKNEKSFAKMSNGSKSFFGLKQVIPF